jgi:hypothetical protein
VRNDARHFGTKVEEIFGGDGVERVPRLTDNDIRQPIDLVE